MVNNTLNQPLTRTDLPLFCELTRREREDEWTRVRQQISEELLYFANVDPFAGIKDVSDAITQRTLVAVRSSADAFGIVMPIRDRVKLPVPEARASVPYLRPHTLNVLHDMASDLQYEAKNNDEWQQQLEETSLERFRPAITSMTRTSTYQRMIANAGALAIGREGSKDHSTHEKGYAFDIDHGAFYATASAGQESALNRRASSKNFAKLAVLLPVFRQMLRSVVEQYRDDGTIYAVEEIPNGWGTWHIAVKE